MENEGRKIFKIILLIVVVIMWLLAVSGIVYPVIKAFLVYQSGITEQQAFNAVMIPIFVKGFLLAGISSLLGLFVYFFVMQIVDNTYEDDEK